MSKFRRIIGMYSSHLFLYRPFNPVHVISKTAPYTRPQFYEMQTDVFRFTCCHRQGLPITITGNSTHQTADVGIDCYHFLFRNQVAFTLIVAVYRVGTRYTVLTFCRVTRVHPILLTFQYRTDYVHVRVFQAMMTKRNRQSDQCSSNPLIPVLCSRLFIAGNYSPRVGPKGSHRPSIIWSLICFSGNYAVSTVY